MQDTRIAVDVAKSVLEVAVSQRPGRMSDRHRFTRRRFARFRAEQAPATVVMEACGMSHFWGREARARGHTVRLLPPRDVRPCVRGNKTDRRCRRLAPRARLSILARSEQAPRRGRRYVCSPQPVPNQGRAKRRETSRSTLDPGSPDTACWAADAEERTKDDGREARGWQLAALDRARTPASSPTFPSAWRRCRRCASSSSPPGSCVRRLVPSCASQPRLPGYPEMLGWAAAFPVC